MIKVKKTGLVKNGMKPKDIINHVHTMVKRLAIDCENHAKEIISEKSLDTGQFLNSIWTETLIKKNIISFKLYDGVKYGIYWEKGTKLHWVPFYRNGDVNDPILADWGHRVLGLSQKEMLSMGGMRVKIPAVMPFLKSLLFIQGVTSEEFKKLETKFRKRVKYGM